MTPEQAYESIQQCLNDANVIVDNPMNAININSAMLKFAQLYADQESKSQSISFSTWKDREYLLSGGITTDGGKLYRHKHALNGKRFTLDALYTLFLTSQTLHP